MADKASNSLKITLIKSTIGAPKKTKECVKALGLRKLHHQVVRPDDSVTRGLIHKINHLLTVEHAS